MPTHKAQLLVLFAIVLNFLCVPHGFAQDQKAKSINVLLSSSSSAATPSDVIEYFSTRTSRTSFPFAALAIQNPTKASYLLPVRASGDFLAYLSENPDLDRAKLERYITIYYDSSADSGAALTALRADSSVEAAYLTTEVELSSASLTEFEVDQGDDLVDMSAGFQYGRDALNIDAAWQVAGGYSLVGVVDSGLYQLHPLLRQFSSSGQYLGGNFVPASSLDISFTGIGAVTSDIPTFVRTDVDEMGAIPYLGPQSYCVSVPGNLPSGPLVPRYAGHGTHVAGLVASNGAAGQPKGTCKHCGIAAWKFSYPYCGHPAGTMFLGNDFDAATAAVTLLSDTGAQVINMSFRLKDVTSPTACTDNPNLPFCLSISYATHRGVALVAASGNDRSAVDFPARDSRVVATGGFDSSLNFWDESPGSNQNCPAGNSSAPNSQCGSNYTTILNGPQQELMASAKAVMSTTYPGMNWNTSCGDGIPWGSAFNGGTGPCTGTSMSSPQISGLFGLIRSINPLVYPSVPVPNSGLFQPVGVRTVVARSTIESLVNPGFWDSRFGYGTPDASVAARKMLGRVAGRQVLNRVTPLFRFYSMTASDYGESVSPQMATAFIVNQQSAYQPQGQTIPGYSSFPPPPPGTTAIPAPKAAIYVLTTEYSPQPGYPPLLPLHLIDRARAYPVGCSPGAPGCNTANRDMTLVTTKQHIEQAYAQGYSLRTIQGYIYAPCSPESTCIPPAAQKLYRKCKVSMDDCAIFLESERSTFEAQGYTAAFPSGASTMLGYAYPSTDSDGDGLVDGMEYAIGSNPFSAPNSADALSYPLAGVPVSDPCLGPAAAGCSADKIFRNGFN